MAKLRGQGEISVSLEKWFELIVHAQFLHQSSRFQIARKATTYSDARQGGFAAVVSGIGSANFPTKMNTAKTRFQDKPAIYPRRCPNGAAMKSLPQALLDRRATSHFKPDAVPEEYLEAMLRFAGQAPSGYNVQPWRFLVVREKENRQRLQAAAYNQEKIIEAPVVIIAFAIRDDWKNYLDDIFEESLRRGYGKPD
jgi:hypothetical protein